MHRHRDYRQQFALIDWVVGAVHRVNPLRDQPHSLVYRRARTACSTSSSASERIWIPDGLVSDPHTRVGGGRANSRARHGTSENHVVFLLTRCEGMQHRLKLVPKLAAHQA